MIYLNDKPIQVDHFPDNTQLLKLNVKDQFGQAKESHIFWQYESDEELVTLIYLTGHLRAHGVERIQLHLPYCPNARMDRVKDSEDVFTLKYFANIINSLNFECVHVLDPHSNVTPALIDRVVVHSPEPYIDRAIQDIYAKHGGVNSSPLVVFFPDEGASKRYSDMVGTHCAFGIKKREWKTGKILGLDVSGDIEAIKGRNVLIVDDLSSYGGTFYFSALKLKELGANKIYLYVTHCEDKILEGKIFPSGLIEKVYTTDSIFGEKAQLKLGTSEYADKMEVFKI